MVKWIKGKNDRRGESSADSGKQSVTVLTRHVAEDCSKHELWRLETIDHRWSTAVCVRQSVTKAKQSIDVSRPQDQLYGRDRRQSMTVLFHADNCIQEQPAWSQFALGFSASAVAEEAWWCEWTSTRKTRAGRPSSSSTEAVEGGALKYWPELHCHGPDGTRRVMSPTTGEWIWEETGGHSVAGVVPRSKQRRFFRLWPHQEARIEINPEIADYWGRCDLVGADSKRCVGQLIETTASCRPEDLSLRWIQLQPVWSHPRCNVVNAGGDDVLELQWRRWWTESADLHIVCVEMRRKSVTLYRRL